MRVTHRTGIRVEYLSGKSLTHQQGMRTAYLGSRDEEFYASDRYRRDRFTTKLLKIFIFRDWSYKKQTVVRFSIGTYIRYHGTVCIHCVLYTLNSPWREETEEDGKRQESRKDNKAKWSRVCPVVCHAKKKLSCNKWEREEDGNIIQNQIQTHLPYVLLYNKSEMSLYYLQQKWLTPRH